MQKKFKEFKIVEAQELALSGYPKEVVIDKLQENKGLNAAVNFIAEQMLNCWGFPEFDSVKLNKDRAKQRLLSAGYSKIFDVLNQGKLSEEKVEEAVSIRREKGDIANRSQTLESYIYLYAKGGMRLALLDELHEQFPTATAYTFEHLLRAHKGEEKVEMPICFCFVEEVCLAINSSGAKNMASKKQTEAFLKSFCYSRHEYSPVYRDIHNSPEMQRLIKHHKARIQSIAGNTYSDETKKQNIAAENLDYAIEYANLVDQNNNNRKTLISIMEDYLMVKKATFREKKVDILVSQRINLLKSI